MIYEPPRSKERRGTPEGKSFTEERLAAGAIELRGTIYTAWLRNSGPVQEFHG